MKSICIFLFALLVLSYFIPEPTLGQSANLIEAAKKEGGKVIVYGSLQDSSMEPIGKAFQAKTGLELSYWRGTATKVMDRVLSEHRAGKPLYDVILTNDNPMEIMQKEGIFAKYDSPVAKDYPDSAINPETGPIYRFAIVAVVYNKSVIKPGDIPKSLEDLLKPQFRGKLAMPDPTQDLVTFAQKGAPMDYVRLTTMLGTNHYIGLSKRAPHTNAGKTFIDFFLGEESMSIMAKNGESVNRKGVYPPIPEIEKVKVIEMEDFDTNGFAEKRKEYQKIFLR